MATVIAPSVILGERPDRTGHRRFSAARRNVEHLRDAAPAAYVLRPATGATLTDLAAAVETSPATTVVLRGDALPAALQSRVPLALLQRRADRHGKRLYLIADARELRRVAAAAGMAMWDAAAGREVSTAETDTGAPAADPIPGQTLRSSIGRVAAPAGAPALPRLTGRRPGGGRTVTVSRPTAWQRAARPLRRATAAAETTGYGRAAILATAVGLLGILVAWMVVPSAQVHLTSNVEAWSADLPLSVDPAAKRPDAARGILPGRTISKEVAESAQAPATGRKVVPDAIATGQVVFVNKTDKTVTVPKGTIILAGATRFVTREDATVAATVAAGMQPRVGMGRINVSAVSGGPTGNVDRFQINKVEGPLAALLDVQNDVATRGGTEKQITHVTADDRRKLQESLQRTLSDRLLQQVKAQLPTSDKETVVPWPGQNPQVVEATFNKNVDEEATAVSLTLKLRYGATVFANDSYNSLVRQMAGGRVEQTKPGFEVVADTLRPEAPDVASVDDGALRLNGRASASVRPRLDVGDLRRALANQPIAQARSYLGALPGVAAVELQTSPGWLGRLPWLGLRISIAVDRGDPGAAPGSGGAPAGGAPAADGSVRRSPPNGP